MNKNWNESQQKKWDEEFVIPEKEFIETFSKMMKDSPLPITAICQRLHVSPGTLYRWCRQAPDVMTRRAAISAMNKLNNFCKPDAWQS